MNIFVIVLMSLNLSLSSGIETRFYKSDGVRIIEETDIGAWQGNFSLGLNYSYFHPETTMAFQERLGVLKGYAETHNQHVLLRVGSSYITFGRGLILYAAKDEVLKMDRFINGLYMEVAGPAGIVKAFGGISKVYIDHQLQPDSTSLLFGSDALFNFMKGVKVGGSVLEARAKDNTKTDYYSLRTILGKGSLAMYFEFGMRSGFNKILQMEKQGFADYLSISYSRENFGAVAEFRDYWLFGKDYGIPPTLNKSGIYLNEAMDERAAALTLNFAPSDFYTANLSLSRLYSTGYYGKKSDMNEVFWQNQFQDETHYGEVDLGYLKLTNGQIAIGVGRREEIEPEFDYGWQMGTYSLEISFKNRKRIDDGKHYTDRDVAFSIGLGENYGVIFTVQNRVGDLRNRWSNVEFKGQIFNNLSLDLIVGSMRGDFVCSGGICRYEPEFSGVMLKATVVF